MDPVVIGSEGTTMVFADPQSLGADSADLLSVTLTGPDLHASRQVYAGWVDGFAHLATFFTGLADQWRGWTGVLVFESVEGDLRIEATHDGHVNLRVTLSESTVLDGWTVRATVRLDAGEALSDAGRDVALLVSPPAA
ncbi:DUF6228 family protein [Nocardioides flavescens]|uniref:Uncharacterized protein n=1 Tax=Nocardioides flavescens TaxID=2691959 RepID=A0A6L7EVP4_9ACTN|nr:DUF6228 family protein [Nocardioides flavescens]MXG91557.1 hypothetical protein [Nocardioides flavescens]